MNSQLKAEFSPVPQDKRIYSIDIIRGIALLGILLMNIVGFGLAYSYSDPTVSGGSDGWNFKIWAVNFLLSEGTMRGLFAMLFGVSFTILISRGLEKGGGINVADIYYRRILWLLLFGLIHGYVLLWYGDILFVYAICGLVLFAFRKTKPVYLILFGVLILAIGSLRYVKTYYDDLEIMNEGFHLEELKDLDHELTESQEQTLKLWEEKKGKISEKQIQKKEEVLSKGYFSIAKYRAHRTMRNHTVNLYEYLIWDNLSFMLIGMAFFSWGIFQGKRSFRFYLMLMLVGYAIGLPINFYELDLISSSNFDVIAISKAQQTYHLGRLFTTIGHIGLFMLFIKIEILLLLKKALAAVGKMALTNYLTQTLLCNIYFLGFGMYGKLERYELYYLVIAIWILQLIYSYYWLQHFKYGPFEWLWRSLTYQKMQPFRLNN